MSKKTLQQIIQLLDRQEISFTHLQHETIPKDSKSASLVRGTDHTKGAKALIVQNKEEKYFQIVLPAHKMASLKKVRKLLGEKNVFLASPTGVQERTDCIVGSVPPIGILWNVQVLIDESLLENELVVFSAGTLEDSIKISPQELVRVNKAQVVDICKE